MPKWIPDGWHSLTTRLVVDKPDQLVAFLQLAFGATGESSAERPALMQIGDSIVMVSGVGPRKATSAFLYLYVEDVDATYQRAVRAGATSLEPPRELPYGDRRAMIRDPAGNDWQIATHHGLVRERTP